MAVYIYTHIYIEQTTNSKTVHGVHTVIKCVL